MFGAKPVPGVRGVRPAATKAPGRASHASIASGTLSGRLRRPVVAPVAPLGEGLVAGMAGLVGSNDLAL